nr:phage tail protein [Pseudomonas sp. A46]
MANNVLQLRVLLSALDKVSGPLKKIRDGSGNTAKALKATYDQLKALNNQQSDIAAYRKHQAAISATATKLEAAHGKVRQLKAELKKGPVPATFRTDMRKALDAVKGLTDKIQEQRKGLGPYATSLREAGISANKFREHETRLKSEIDATNRSLKTQKDRLAAVSKIEAGIRTARRTYDQRRAFGRSAAMSGASSMAAAYGIGRGLYAPIREGKHFALEENRIAAFGLGDAASADAIKFAKAMKTYGTSATDNIALVRDAMAVFADVHHAELVAPTLARMKFANEAMFGEEQGADNERKFMDMLKVIELRGGLASADAFKRQANIVQQVLTATGGRVGPEEWLNVIKTGGIAAKGLKDEAFYYQMEPLVQEMGGFRVGTAMMSAYSNLYQGRTTKRAARNLERLGLIDPAKIKHDKAGQISFLDVGAIKGSELFRSNQFEWLEKVLLPQLAAQGITEKNQVLDTLGSIFSNRTASNLFAQMYLQREQIHKNAGLNAGADGIDQLYGKGLQTAQGKELEMLAKRANAYKQMSDTLLPAYLELLETITEAIDGITGWMKENPRATALMLKGLLVVGALAAAFGALALTLASLIAPFAVVSYGMALFRFRGLGLLQLLGALFPSLAGLATALAGPLITALRTVSIALWGLAANPVVLVIAAIVALLVGAAYLIYRNWDRLAPYFQRLWAEVKAGFQDGIGGILNVLGNFNPLGLLYRAMAEAVNYLGANLPVQFTELGNMIVRGLVSGLLNGLSQIKSAIGTLGETTINWFKTKLGIRSPSRVFAGLGSDTMAGLAQGLAAGEQGPLAQLGDLAKRMTGIGALTLGMAGSAVAIDNRPPLAPSLRPVQIDSHDSIQIIIQPHQGMDAQAIARAVAQELDKRERARLIRARSALFDRE